MTTPEINSKIAHEKWVRKIADNRVSDCILRATMALNSNYNNPSLRLFGGIKRFSWL